MDSSSYLQIFLWNKRGVVSIWRTELQHEVWILDLWWQTGKLELFIVGINVKLGVFFSWEPALLTQNSQDRVTWRWMSQKNIAIYTYKQRPLSMDMKTKVVEHVEREWESERVFLIPIFYIMG